MVKVVAIDNEQSSAVVLMKFGSERKMLRLEKEPMENMRKETSMHETELSQVKVCVFYLLVLLM
jgi:hypothetical protein